ncbi:CTU1 protein, partial [Podargus strigoides]|nr:CTU1 protein [Podargus strigoides]
AALLRPRTAEPLCRRCFLLRFEAEAQLALRGGPPNSLPPPRGATVVIASSGGKDSTVLGHLLRRLGAARWRLALLAVDEGIAGYREEALGAVRRNRGGLPLLLLSHRELYGYGVDDVGGGVTGGAGGGGNWQGVGRGAEMYWRGTGVYWCVLGASPPGHNADDLAETVLMNFLRGDVARLRRSATGVDTGATTATGATGNPTRATRSSRKGPPLRHAYEKEIVLYAHFLGLDYFSTECSYAPHAYRGHARTLLKDLEATRASSVAALGHSGRRLVIDTEVATKSLGVCGRCGFAASQALCKACVLLASLERGLPRVGLGKRGVEMAAGMGGGG